ncbi:MAG: radical SAM protein [bacterium]
MCLKYIGKLFNILRWNCKERRLGWKELTLERIHIELSNYCNAACPACPRCYYGTELVRPELALSQIYYENFIKFFSEDIISKINSIIFCGANGDPLTARDILPIIRYITTKSPNCLLRIHTNGGLRSPEFFKELAETLKLSTNSAVIFSIDGLKNTNHIYRRKVDWDVLIKNVQNFIKNGGRAEWDFLIFKHNEHQIKEAEELAKELGFAAFNLKRALGFESGEEYIGDMGVYDKDGKYIYSIFPPSEVRHRNCGCKKVVIKTSKDHISLKTYDKVNMLKYNPIANEKLNNFQSGCGLQDRADLKKIEYKKITCKSHLYDKAELFVNANGMVFPCCFIGTAVESGLATYELNELRYLIKKAGIDNFSLHKRKIADILESGLFDEVFAKSWDRPSFKKGKIAYCTATCSDNNCIDRISMNEEEL